MRKALSPELGLLTVLLSSLVAFGQTTLSPSSLSFGNQVLNVASSVQYATFQNNLTVSVAISTVTIAGGTAPAEYTWTTNCPVSPNRLAAGKSCKIAVTLTPSALGLRTSTLTLTHSAATSPQSVNLSGTGVQPVSLSVSSLSFGAIAVGNTTAPKSVTLTNFQKTTLSFSSIVSTSDFVIASNTCGTSLAARTSCKVGITFNPSTTGLRTGTLTFNDIASNNPQVVSLSGTGSLPVTTSPSNLTFPAQTLGTASTPQSITVANHLNAAVTLSAPTITGDFSISGNACGSSLGAGLQCTIQVTFSPAAIGARSGSLKVAFNAFGSPRNAALAGTGAKAALVSIAVTPANTSTPAGGTQQFTATGTYTDGSTQDLTRTSSWSSSATTVATINAASGFANAVSPGTSSIQATSGAISGATVWTISSVFLSPGSLNTARSLQSSTLLNNGKTLVVGGDGSCCRSGAGPLTSAELFDSSAGDFSFAANLNTARESHSATLLNNGKVLIVGGDNSGSALASAELYDPAAFAFSLTASMNTAREAHTATLLNNGLVLIAGGMAHGSPQATAELYNPANGTFSPTGRLNTARYSHTATLLNNGMVLVVGGMGNTGPRADVELYDPASGVFTSIAGLTLSRAFHTATLLNSGQVLIAGGLSSSPGPSATSEVYDPVARTFTLAGAMSTPRLWHTATLMNNGKVLVAGGSADTQCCILASAEIFDPGSGGFSPAPTLPQARVHHAAILLTNGNVLLTGGLAGGNFNTIIPPLSAPLASSALYLPDASAPPNLVSIAVSPNSPTVLIGTSQRLIATGTYSDNSTARLASVTWTSSNSAAAQVSNDATNAGTAYAVAAGSATVTACAGSVCGSVLLTVPPPPLASITVSPANPSVAAGLTTQFSAFANYVNGSTQDITSTVSWSSSSVTVATINSSGLATGLLAGNSATITAASGSISGTATLNVTPAILLSIAVAPPNPSVPLGSSQPFTATGQYSDGSTQDFTSTATWSSSVPLVATLNPSGTATTLAQGTTTVSATVNATAGITLLTVTPPALVSIAVSPGNTSSAVGSTQQFTATGTYSDGSAQSITSTAAWISSSPAIASVAPASGLGSALAPGHTVIQASSGAISGSTNWSVSPGFLLTGSLNMGRGLHTATLLNSQKTLLAGGDANGNALSAAELYDPSSGAVSLTGNLNVARESHTATLLNNGKVLIAGGGNAGNSLSSTELYDPAAGNFTLSGSLITARQFHTATLLNNGFVLIAGGQSAGTALATAELYNPATGSSVATGSMTSARYAHTATLLKNGLVLIAGGGTDSAELFNPATGTFSLTGSLSAIRSNHTATLLSNGTVLIAGGENTVSGAPVSLSTAELYDPVAGSFNLTGSLNAARASHSANLLDDDTVLVAGGQDLVSGTILRTAEIYDPAVGVFTSTGSMNTARSSHTATLLTNGMVLAAGSTNGLPTAELYKPGTLTPPDLVSIAVAALAASISPGDTQRLVATGTFSDGSTSPLPSVTWSSSSPNIAQISNDSTDSGSLLGISSGAVTITATEGDISSAIPLTVMPAAPDPLGTVDRAINVPCPGIAGGTCYAITVTCPEVPDYTGYLKVFSAAAPVGFAMLGTGGLGVGLYENDTYGWVTIKNLLAANFSVAEISFGAPFVSTTVQPVQGWQANTSGVGMRKGACRYATIANWVKQNLTPSQPFCVSGNSAGAAVIGYGLAHYDLDNVLKFALLTSGPPFSRVDYACDQSQSPALEYCTNLQRGMSAGYDNETRFLDPAYLPIYSAACSSMDMSHSTALDGMFLPDSINSPDGKLNYAIPLEFMYGGLDTRGAAINQGEYYRRSITSPTQRSCIADAPHTISDALDGAQAIATEFINNCH